MKTFVIVLPSLAGASQHSHVSDEDMVSMIQLQRGTVAKMDFKNN